MIQSTRIDEIKAFQEAGKARIASAFRAEPRLAESLTKGEFDKQYPAAEYERYSVSSLTNFRKQLEEELSKGGSEGESADDMFKKATADLKVFLVNDDEDNAKRAFIFVRKKEAGE